MIRTLAPWRRNPGRNGSASRSSKTSTGRGARGGPSRCSSGSARRHSGGGWPGAGPQRPAGRRLALTRTSTWPSLLVTFLRYGNGWPITTCGRPTREGYGRSDPGRRRPPAASSSGSAATPCRPGWSTSCSPGPTGRPGSSSGTSGFACPWPKSGGWPPTASPTSARGGAPVQGQAPAAEGRGGPPLARAPARRRRPAVAAGGTRRRPSGAPLANGGGVTSGRSGAMSSGDRGRLGGEHVERRRIR